MCLRERVIYGCDGYLVCLVYPPFGGADGRRRCFCLAGALPRFGACPSPAPTTGRIHRRRQHGPRLARRTHQRSGWDRSRLILSDPRRRPARDGIHTLLGLGVHADNAAAAISAVLVFAVEAAELAESPPRRRRRRAQRRPLVVAVAAGVRVAVLERWLGGSAANLPVVRDAEYRGAGRRRRLPGFSAPTRTSATMRTRPAESILRAVGFRRVGRTRGLLDAS